MADFTLLTGPTSGLTENVMDRGAFLCSPLPEHMAALKRFLEECGDDDLLGDFDADPDLGLSGGDLPDEFDRLIEAFIGSRDSDITTRSVPLEDVALEVRQKPAVPGAPWAAPTGLDSRKEAAAAEVSTPVLLGAVGLRASEPWGMQDCHHPLRTGGRGAAAIDGQEAKSAHVPARGGHRHAAIAPHICAGSEVPRLQLL